MLVLTRKPGERILVGDDIVVTLISIRRDDDYGPKIRIGLEAPSDVVIRREEVPDLREAGQPAPAEASLDSLETETRQLRQKGGPRRTARENPRAAAARVSAGAAPLKATAAEVGIGVQGFAFNRDYVSRRMRHIACESPRGGKTVPREGGGSLRG